MRSFSTAAARVRPPAQLLRLRNVPILDALRLEEALFRADARSWLITNVWDDAAGGRGADGRCTLTGQHRQDSEATAIVLGISGKAHELVHLDRARAAGVPLCRRFSGGGTVIVDTSTVFVTFLVAGDALPEVAPYPEPMLRWTSGLYDDALRRCGVGGFATHANDYCIDDRKFGGNAQSISGKRWLHHTSLLMDYEPQRMSLLQMPAKRPEYRASRAHDDFVRGLSAAGVASKAQLLDAIVAAAAERFELREVGVEDTEAARAAKHRKTTRPVEYDGS